MTRTRLGLLVASAMFAFAANSLLCRSALRNTGIDAASFTALRLVSGALVLGLLARTGSGPSGRHHGSWWSALALFSYAAAFSFAYRSLSAGTGALLLFGSVQATMIGFALWSGERLRSRQSLGVALAVVGLVILLLPGLAAPPVGGALLMTVAGLSWGVYSLRGRGALDPLRATGGNFLRTVPMVGALALAAFPWLKMDLAGALYAIASGALASGLGYAVWYKVLPVLKASQASIVQLSVPLLTATGGILFLGETLRLRLVLAAVATLGGIALVVWNRKAAKP
jgi:drug/metabolite transporter (DMT)-like permease